MQALYKYLKDPIYLPHRGLNIHTSENNFDSPPWSSLYTINTDSYSEPNPNPKHKPKVLHTYYRVLPDPETDPDLTLTLNPNPGPSLTLIS